MGHRDENDVGLLIGQRLLDAINEARINGDFKGWTYKEMIHGPSVLPYTVYDEKDPDETITEHVCIVSIGKATMTLMRTTAEGTTFQEFVAISKPKKV